MVKRPYINSVNTIYRNRGKGYKIITLNIFLLYIMLDGLFEPKSIKEFSGKLQKVFNLLTISRKVRVVGSAGFKNMRYVNDYDLNELFKRNFDTKEALDEIYKMFKNKFKVAEKDDTLFITDLKCGEDCDGEPLRWDKHDIQRGTKKMSDGRTIKFQDCILMKVTFKMDIVKIIDGKFTEFSDNYFIKLGDDANFFQHDFQLDHLKNNLKHSYDTYFYTCQNLFKGLKRAFSYYLLDGEGKNEHILKKLFAFFNSPTGKLYQLKGQIGTILLAMENSSGFRNPKISDVKKNIKLIISELEPIPSKRKLQLASTASSKSKIIKYLEDAEEDLFHIINRITADWVLKNKDVPIY